MGNTDSIPVVSQAKSGVQLLCGDVDGAARTQENFVRECPVVSQVTSTVQLLAGDTDGAIETQKRCGRGLSNLADGIPVVGHGKALVHMAVNDKEGAERAMKAATRTTGVMAAGAGGFLVGGPVGAVAGGIAGGAAFDTAVTVGESIENDEYRPTGYLAAIDNAVKNPNPGDIFDLAFMPVADGAAGYAGGQMAKSMQASSGGKPTAAQVVKAEALEAQATATLEAAEAGKMNMKSVDYMTEMNRAKTMYNQAQQLKGKSTAPVNLKQAPPPNIPAEVTATTSVTQTAQGQRSRTETSHSRSKQERRRECICKPIKLRVLFLNTRSINPRNRTAPFEEKIARIRRTIAANQPDIVAFVESWLTRDHEDVDIVARLGLHGYQIYRQDRGSANPMNAYGDFYESRSSRRGGGILVAFRCTDFSVSMERTYAEDYLDNVMNFDINCQYSCRKCNKGRRSGKFAFVVVYRRPGAYDDEASQDFEETNRGLIDRLAHLCSYYPNDLASIGYNGFAMVGDFNWSGQSWFINYVRGYENLLTRPSRSATHARGGDLDHVISSPPSFVTDDGVHVTGLISDHSALVFELNIGKDVRKGQKCRRCDG